MFVFFGGVILNPFGRWRSVINGRDNVRVILFFVVFVILWRFIIIIVVPDIALSITEGQKEEREDNSKHDGCWSES